jgi:hypothetical protein
MTTIVRNVKIPAHSIHIHKGATVNKQKRKTADAVTPSVKGRQGVKPSTIGIAAQKRFAQLANVAAVTGDFLSTLNRFRASQDAAENPQFAALLDDPKFMAVIQRVVAKIGTEVDSITRDSLSAARNEVAGSAEERDEINQRIAKEEGLGGFDAARPILTAEDAERVERARSKLSRLKTAEGMGDAGDIVRARYGYEPRALDADGLYESFEGKRK